VQFRGKSIRSIKPLGGGTELDSAEIEPELITNLFDSAREKRRPVRYEDLPVMLVGRDSFPPKTSASSSTVVFDFIRIAGAAWADLRQHQPALSGPPAPSPCRWRRTFFLSTDRNWRRKLSEAMISIELEDLLLVEAFARGSMEIMASESFRRQLRSVERKKVRAHLHGDGAGALIVLAGVP